MFWQFGRTRLRHLLRCLMLFSMLFILVGAGRIQAQAAGVAEYPAWVRQAVVGTAYTADEFVGLPFEQQLQIVQTLHPEIDPTALTISTAAAEPNSLIQANTANMTVNPLAAGNTLLDIAPSDNNKAFAYFNIGTPSTQTVPSGVAFDGVAPGGSTPVYVNGSPVPALRILSSAAKTIDPGTLTTADFSSLGVADFHLDLTSSDLGTGDFSLSYNAGGSTPPNVTITVKDPTKLPYSGKKIVFRVTKNNHSTQVTFNLWRPDITRASAVLPLGNNLSLRYMFGAYQPAKAPSHLNYDLTTQTNNFIDTPNYNIIQTDPNTHAETTVYSLYEAPSLFPDGSSQKDTPVDFTNLYTTRGLGIGFKGAPWIPWGSGNVDNVSPLIQFDDIKHIHMYADSVNPQVIRLDYDGYITNSYYLKILGVSGGSIALRVRSQLQPSTDNRQMSLSQQVTNISGQNLTGIYFARQLDVRIGPKGNPMDDVPPYYGALAQDGPRQGKPQGIYFRSPYLSSPFIMQFNFNSLHGPDSWSGTHWIEKYTGNGSDAFGRSAQSVIDGYVTATGTNVYRAGNTTGGDQFPNGYPVFKGPEGKGNAGDVNAQPDQLLFGKDATSSSSLIKDSAIIMKWSPSQVGTFNDGDTFEMGFNSGTNSGTAPILRTDTKYLHIPQTAKTVAAPGSVFDLNSNQATVYYQVDGEPVTSSNALAIANKKTLFAAKYPTDPPHNTYLPFAGDISNPADVQTLADGKEHTIYLYAIDTPDNTVPNPYKQDGQLVSNVIQIAVNRPATVNIHLLDAAGAALTPTQADSSAIANPVVKNGTMPDPYNFNDFSIGSTSILTTSETTLQGHPPLTLTSAGQQYDLDQTRLPSNGQGTLTPASGTLDLNYYYKKHSDTGGLLKLTVPTIDFGQQSLNMGIGSYPISSLTGSLVVTNQNTTNKSFQLSAQATTPLTNAAGQTLPGALGYQLSGTTVADLSDPVIVYANTNAAAPDTTFNISNSWWQANQPQTGDYQIGGPRLQINAVNKPAISAGKYTGVITWTVTNGL